MFYQPRLLTTFPLRQDISKGRRSNIRRENISKSGRIWEVKNHACPIPRILSWLESKLPEQAEQVSETASLAICQPAGDSCTLLTAYSRTTTEVRIYTHLVQLMTAVVIIKQISTEKWTKTKKASPLKPLRRKKKNLVGLLTSPLEGWQQW